MKSRRVRLLLFFTFSVFFNLKNNAQGDLRIGDWRAMMPYNTGKYVTQSAEHVFWSTGLSVLKMAKSDFSIEKLEKNAGLSGVGVNLVRYNKANKTLFVFYSDQTIDLVKDDGSIETLTDIKNNKSIIGDKSVNDLFFRGDTAFLAASFGVLRLDMRRREFLSTTFTRQKVNSVAVFEEKIYAHTEGGIFRIVNDRRLNIADFNQWQKLSVGFPTSYTSRVACVFNQNYYFDIGDSTIFSLKNDLPQRVFSDKDGAVRSLTADNAHLVLAMRCRNGAPCNSRVYYLNKNEQQVGFNQNCPGDVKNAIEDEKGGLWVGDGFQYFRFNQKVGDPCGLKIFDAPFTSTASDFFINDTALIVATGGTKDGTGYRENADGFSVFSKNSWSNFNPLLSPIADNNFYLNINCVELDSRTGKLYAGSYWAGILQVENGRVTKTYDKTNSLLRGALGDINRERISDMTFDKNGNLWISNSQAASPLVVLKPDGTWRQMLPIGGIANGTIQIAIDSFSGYKWLTVRGTGTGILVYDEGKNLDDLTDDQFRFLDAGTLPRELQTASITCLAFDLNGQLWVGTTNGVAVYRNCGNPFKDGCQAEQVASELGGIGEFLLREQQVNSITIDGANRIWFGTSSGIFVQTEGGRKEVAKFNVDNSPLLSNNVTALGIRGSTGEVFIGTDKGLMVYKSDAIAGGEFNKVTAYAYPNPVRPDYQGSIAIKGLARDATVKITDISGNLVYETRSLGGQAIWDGRDFSGQRAATGVYLVYAANTTNVGASDAIVTKILFVN